MGYYPVFLDLRGRSCVVIGGGEEAERKALGLVEAGAHVTVICHEESPAFQNMSDTGQITLHQRRYDQGDLAGVFLALSATTDDRELSEEIAREAEAEKVLLNVVDVTDLCTWIFPAIVRRGEVTIAISTNGGSPAMARFLRTELDKSLPEEYGMLANILAEVRNELRRRRVRVLPDAWQDALDSETMSLLADQDWDGVQAHIMTSLENAAGRNGSA